MNANPADCDCERCEIERERALYQGAWLTAAIATLRKPMEPCWR